MADKLNFTTKKLNQSSSMPQMSTTLSGWQSEITLIKTIQSVVDGELVVSTISTLLNGVIQPMSAKQVALKPEGSRAFQWYTIHVVSGSEDLDTDDIIEIDSMKYKIMEKWSWDRNGFIEYHAIKDYE